MTKSTPASRRACCLLALAAATGCSDKPSQPSNEGSATAAKLLPCTRTLKLGKVGKPPGERATSFIKPQAFAFLDERWLAALFFERNRPTNDPPARI